ncbi:methyltransferase domain-containing protein [uncultured Thalassospira sp.]|uniref:class I SAM-dependent methyltransferase n=1 Tax=uncultured Thalassospira sp. TaxID=404382 RepID=UPI0032B24309|tara:strand:- start:18090 stop:18968 length:879 start_codon:yes stop_codon:yes gene_type:complete
MRKINIGAGSSWYQDGWELLDNGSGTYKEPWKHQGKCWDSHLPDDTYDIVFTSHMLEHIPHFRLEKTIAEFNRIMKIGGTLRILVPNLKKYATAYVNGDTSYFSGSQHYADHLGIGGSFVRLMISPGQQTLAVSREMDEIFGGYAHLYAFDFDMMRILLEKWGFGEIVESEPGESALEELRDMQHLVHDGKRYDRSDDFVKKNKYRKTGKDWHFSGFDKGSSTQLVVEAKKIASITYEYSKEYEYNKQARFDDPLSLLKLRIYRIISRMVDFSFLVSQKSGLLKLLKPVFRR